MTTLPFDENWLRTPFIIIHDLVHVHACIQHHQTNQTTPISHPNKTHCATPGFPQSALLPYYGLLNMFPFSFLYLSISPVVHSFSGSLMSGPPLVVPLSLKLRGDHCSQVLLRSSYPCATPILVPSYHFPFLVYCLSPSSLSLVFLTRTIYWMIQNGRLERSFHSVAKVWLQSSLCWSRFCQFVLSPFVLAVTVNCDVTCARGLGMDGDTDRWPGAACLTVPNPRAQLM